MAHDSLSTELQKNQKRIQQYDYVKRLYKNAKDNAGSVDREIKLMEALINVLLSLLVRNLGFLFVVVNFT